MIISIFFQSMSVLEDRRTQLSVVNDVTLATLVQVRKGQGDNDKILAFVYIHLNNLYTMAKQFIYIADLNFFRRISKFSSVLLVIRKKTWVRSAWGSVVLARGVDPPKIDEYRFLTLRSLLHIYLVDIYQLFSQFYCIVFGGISNFQPIHAFNQSGSSSGHRKIDCHYLIRISFSLENLFFIKC